MPSALELNPFLHFYRATPNAAHGIAKAYLSVRLSIKRVDCEKTKETCAHSLYNMTRTHEDWLVGGGRFIVPEIVGQKRIKNADFRLKFARSASAITPCEKS